MATNKVDETLAKRAKTHGDFSSVSRTAQTMKRTVRAGDTYEQLDDGMKEAVDMILHKISRIVNGDCKEPDHWLDIEGYARRGGESCHTPKSSLKSD